MKDTPQDLPPRITNENLQDLSLSIEKTREIWRKLEPISWIITLIIIMLTTLLLLIPYWGTGGHFPSTPPGTFPDRPDEVYSISLFRGTIWENSFWRDLFWRMFYPGCCFWVPMLVLTLFLTGLEPVMNIGRGIEQVEQSE